MTIRIYGFWRILSGRQFDDDYAKVNSEHVVPTLVHKGHHVSQSLAIMEYLDEIHPEPRLLPDDAKERAYARSLALVSIADAHPLSAPRVRKHLSEAFSADAGAVQAWCRHWTTEGLASYERILKRRPAAPFALGDTPTIADICIAGQIVLSDLYKLDISAFPEVAKLGKQCWELPAFANAHPFQQPGYKLSNEYH